MALSAAEARVNKALLQAQRIGRTAAAEVPDAKLATETMQTLRELASQEAKLNALITRVRQKHG